MSKLNIRKRNNGTEVVKIKTDNNFFGGIKTILVAALIALQVAILVVLNLYILELFIAYLLISFILSVGTAMYIISTDRNGYSKSVWTLFVLVFFVFGYFFYWISDQRFFFRKSNKRYDKIFQNHKFPQTSVILPNTKKDVQQDIDYLYNTCRFPAFNNCRSKYFQTGTMLFDDMLKALKKAKKFIFIEYFIIADGVLLKRFMDVLKQKAQRGVEVRILYDDMGCHGRFSRKTKKEMAKAGIKLQAFNRLVPIISMSLNFRDHRKIVVIDGKVAYTGGANLADEYINEKRMHGYWKDSGIRCEGEIVDSFSMVFLRQWVFATKKEEAFDQYFGHFENYQNDAVSVFFADGLEYNTNVAKNMFLQTINKSTDKIWIMTPYFVPEESIIDALRNKAMAGADVRIILPDVPDKEYVYKVSLNNAEKLQRYGVKVYKMDNCFVHSKVLLTSYSAIVGSINMDLRSFYQQFENAVYSTDKTLMKEIKKDFESTLTFCTPIGSPSKNIFKRMVVGILRIFSPLM